MTPSHCGPVHLRTWCYTLLVTVSFPSLALALGTQQHILNLLRHSHPVREPLSPYYQILMDCSSALQYKRKVSK
ncbi:hypothetical protein BKA65DRAFT_515758 [Rhexocercosporidium sp. MPI-PUGE-AT-0058]|nr:hypothetical protein BKA65DRAFT_515758 [Rhexocercosporidium sp. MPI-PUGE-AT-0058]